MIISLLPLLLQSGAWFSVHYNWGKKSNATSTRKKGISRLFKGWTVTDAYEHMPAIAVL